MSRAFDDSLVSVIMPAFNAAPFIGEAVASALSQVGTLVEVVVVDDGSSDGTADVVLGIATADSRVRLVQGAGKLGPGRARSLALEAANGRFVAFLDADDVWLPGKLLAQLDVHRSRATVLTHTQYRRVNQAGQNPGRLIDCAPETTWRRVLQNNTVATSSAVVDRAVAGDFRMTECAIDDLLTWYSLLRKGGPARGVRQDLMRYRTLQGSYSRRKWAYAKQTWRDIAAHSGLPFATRALVFAEYAVRGALKHSRY